MKEVRTRFAPSPTGYLHIGGLRTALYAYLYAKKNGGKFILRIEDTDRERYVPGSVEIIYSTMRDAGLIYDEGPDVGGDYGPYIQSERKNAYLEYAKQLVENGSAYYCFCDKERLEKIHSEGATKYDKHCLSLSKEEVQARLDRGDSYVIRQNIPLTGSTTYTDMVFGDITVENKELEDNILIKSDGMPTYNFANVVDDHLMGINYVIRGVEYLSSTPKYNLMYDGLGWERPHYIHLQPIMRDATHKLSKRYGDASYEDFIKKGFLKEAIINYIALLGWSSKDNTEKFSLSELVEKFDLSGVSHSPSIFDEQKMRYINSLYVKEMTEDEFHDYAMKFYGNYDYLKGLDLRYLSSLLCSRVEVFSDIGKLTEFLTCFDGFDLSLFANAKWKTDVEVAKAMLPSLIELTENSFDSLHDALIAYGEKAGYKKGQVLWIYRIALTGAQSTPGGAVEMALLLGKEESLRRLNECLKRLG
ncbi:MAG: glutamate--tRNA ligase [Clostridiales bacterium]|nr:glutamate--tRNA ligase [Clostridiales bacterium]